jgi:hypothetical protein
MNLYKVTQQNGFVVWHLADNFAHAESKFEEITETI